MIRKSAETRALEAKVAASRRADRKANREPKRRPAKPAASLAAPDYMAWQHTEGLECIACLIEGPPTNGEPNPIEVAHQRRNSAAEGWQSNRLGKRVGDDQSAPLCRWHHQLAPNACDKAQGKFWDRLGVDVVAFCRALFAAFKAGEPGHPIIRQFADDARQSRAA